MSKPVLLSGMQPSGTLHLGNYLGALKQFLTYQEEYQSFFMIADYHAMNSVQDAGKMHDNIMSLALDYLGAGIDPNRSIIFKQSDVPQHTELTWIFNTITPMGYLERGHAYKDAVAKKKEVSVGTFDYPMLMAADILLYKPDVVPVGQDQKQHIEFARDTAQKFNNLFGETLSLPKPIIPEAVATIPGVDGEKMSKSHGNVIPLFGTDAEIKDAVAGIKTDSTAKGEPLNTETDITFQLHKHFSQDQLEELTKRYQEGSIGYKESKEILAENIIRHIAPMRERREKYAQNPGKVEKILKKGALKARATAEKTMQEVRKNIGVTR